MTNDPAPQSPIEISPQMLSHDAFAAIVDHFIMREGTDYGREEVSHEAKVKQVGIQIETGQVKIIYDPNTETVTLMTKIEWSKISRSDFL